MFLVFYSQQLSTTNSFSGFSMFLDRCVSFPKQRLRGGVLTFYVHKLIGSLGFSGCRGRVPGLWLAVSGAGGRLWLEFSGAVVVAVDGAFWCRCDAYG